MLPARIPGIDKRGTPVPAFGSGIHSPDGRRSYSPAVPPVPEPSNSDLTSLLIDHINNIVRDVLQQQRWDAPAYHPTFSQFPAAVTRKFCLSAVDPSNIWARCPSQTDSPVLRSY